MSVFRFVVRGIRQGKVCLDSHTEKYMTYINILFSDSRAKSYQFFIKYCNKLVMEKYFKTCVLLLVYLSSVGIRS